VLVQYGPVMVDEPDTGRVLDTGVEELEPATLEDRLDDTDEVGLTIEDKTEDTLDDRLDADEEETDEAEDPLDCGMLEVDNTPETMLLAEEGVGEVYVEERDEYAGEGDEEPVDCDTLESVEELLPVVTLDIVLLKIVLLVDDDGADVAKLDDDVIDDEAEAILDETLEAELEITLDRELAEEETTLADELTDRTEEELRLDEEELKLDERELDTDE